MPHTPVAEKNRRKARSMRRRMTDAELKLRNQLRAHRLMGSGFRRHFPIAGYIADFACPSHRRIVEVDGSQHGDEAVATADAISTGRLEQDGSTRLRFWNDEILHDQTGVCDHIIAVAGMTAVDAAIQAGTPHQEEHA